MTFDEYQKEALRSCGPGSLAMAGLGLAGEAGETVDLIKKHLFHGHDLDKERLCKELGDVLWYLAVMAQFAGIDLAQVAEANIEKLKKRYPNGFSSEASLNRKD